MKLRIILLALASAIALRAADTLPQFNATLTVGKEHRFVLVDAQGKASSFLNLGETFGGYKLKAYDAKSATLDLERDGKISRVTLMADAAVTNAPASPIPATVADAEAVMNKMRFEEMMERALDGQKKAIKQQFQKMGAQFTAQGADPTEVEALQKKMSDELLGVLDAGKLKTDTAKIYSEVFSKQELDQIAAFYSTPIGEVLAAKGPEVQERLSGVIQARMAEVMPRVQQMGREFGQAQKAKREAAGGNIPPPSTTPKK
jgi:hypothetical protein